MKTKLTAPPPLKGTAQSDIVERIEIPHEGRVYKCANQSLADTFAETGLFEAIDGQDGLCFLTAGKDRQIFITH